MDPTRTVLATLDLMQQNITPLPSPASSFGERHLKEHLPRSVPANAMALAEERTSAEVESSKLLHRAVTAGLLRTPL